MAAGSRELSGPRVPADAGAGRSIGLSRIAVRVPEERDDVAEVLRDRGSSAREAQVFTRIFGLRESPSWPLEQRLDDVLVDVGRTALGGTPADLVLYGHSLLMQEVSFRPGFAQRITDGLGLAGTPFLGISGVTCTSMLRAVDVAQDYVRSHPGHRVLVLGGDTGSVAGAARVVPRLTVLGDAAGALVVQDAGYRYRLLGSAGRTDTRFHRSTRMDAQEIQLFGRVVGELVLEALQEALSNAGLSIDQLDWVMPHLVNALAWRFFGENAGIPRERFYLDLLGSQGHVYGLDAFTSLEHADRNGRLRPGDRCALLSAGQGAYFRAAVVEVADDGGGVQ